MSSTTKKSTATKTTAKSTTAKTAKGSEAVAKSIAAKGSEAAAKAASAKKSEAASKIAVAKNEAALKAPVRATSANTPLPKTTEPTLVNKPQPVVLGPVMRKKELIETVVTRTGLKKKDAKPVIEGMLAVLGEALAEGRELILPPLGKVLVRKEKQLPNGKVMVVKVRQSKKPITADPKPFTDAAE